MKLNSIKTMIITVVVYYIRIDKLVKVTKCECNKIYIFFEPLYLHGQTRITIRQTNLKYCYSLGLVT